MMVSDILKLNTVNDLKEVIVDFSSADEQRQYKSSVPYVHIPIEIIEQLSDQVRMLDECKWYAELYEISEIDKLKDFYQFCKKETKKYGKQFPDVPEILSTKIWQDVMSEAQTLRSDLLPKIEKLVNSFNA